VGAGAPADAATIADAAPEASSSAPTTDTSAHAGGGGGGGGGPFQGNYMCGSLWGTMQVHQSGNHVTATHSEAGGTVLYTAQCTVSDTKCVGTFSSKDKKTGKPRGTGPVTIYHYPDKIGYQAGQESTAFCKRE
jgi:hypothetical protein